MVRLSLLCFFLWAGATPAQVIMREAKPAQPQVQRPWNTEVTDYFRILHHQDDEYGKIVGKYAEIKRKELIKKWFKDEPLWRTKCDIYLYQDGHEMAFYAQNMQSWMIAQCVIDYQNNSARALRIDMRIDHVGCWENVLVHEMMHALLGASMGRSPPRWADEGAAGQPEARLTNWGKAMMGKKGFSTKTLMELMDYPVGKDHLDTTSQVQTFYGQSILLVKRMVALKGEKEFVAFLHSASKVGNETALNKHYGMTYKDLDVEWCKEVPVVLAVTSASEKK
jgi:hypothetical protein